MIFRKFKETVRRLGLIKAEDHVLLAFSGGADSTALLSLLVELRKEMPFRLSLAHFNHGLRKNAVKDQEFVLETARKHTLPLYAGNGDVGAYAREKGISIEEAGRLLRYEFLKKTAGKIKANKIATAHTMTDQAETFLLRLLRGSGARGLGGIYPAVEVMIIRPLIGIERPEIEKYLKRKKLRYRTDESNFDKKYRRNKVRLELIPYLKKRFEPAIVKVLARTADILREEEDLLAREAATKTNQAVVDAGGEAKLDATVLENMHPALARRVVREFIAAIKGDLRRITFRDIETILTLGEGKDVTLKKGLTLRRDGGWIGKKTSSAAGGAGLARLYLWDGRGELVIGEAGLSFKGETLTGKNAAAVSYDDEKRVLVDLHKLTLPLVVRGRADGDRYRPIGAPGRQKVKEIMRAKRIPRLKRDALPVFTSGGEIVWAPGCPVGDEFKVTEKTKKVLVIEKVE